MGQGTAGGETGKGVKEIDWELFATQVIALAKGAGIEVFVLCGVFGPPTEPASSIYTTSFVNGAKTPPEWIEDACLGIEASVSEALDELAGEDHTVPETEEPPEVDDVF